MATTLKSVDIAMIGLGAANGTAVLPLTRAGLKVTALEAGTWMRHDQYKPDEIHNNVRRLVTTGRKVSGEIPTFRTGPDQPTRRAPNHVMMNAVGGTSIHYYANSWRFAPWDFKARTESIKRYGANSIPRGSTLEDWPLSYEDLEPYYDTVEFEIGVAGKAGNIQGKIDPAGNTFEGARRREYPMPPMRSTDFIDRMIASSKNLGWNAHIAPAAINTRPYGGRGVCAYHGYCDTGGCHLDAKNSTAVTTIPTAQKTRNLTIVERAHVTRITADANGRVRGVEYLRDGQSYFQPAKVVLLGAYTYENVRLLLLSKSKAYPNGLSNNHGQVGKHYIGHWASRAWCFGLFPKDLNLWYGAMAQGVSTSNWAEDNFDHSGLRFIGGGTVFFNHERHPIAAASAETFGRAPAWGSKWKSYVHDNADRWIAAYIQCNSFPYENTWLDLDPEVKDLLGDPVCRITAGPKENERRASNYAGDKAEQWLREAGAVEVLRVRTGGAPELSTHAVGGTRMGDNPEANVVDKWGFSHEAPNLGIAGGSVLPTHGARNPTETIQALAWRTADHLVRNWKSIVV